MKVGILTLRLYDNYGGILQNYALCRFVKSIGYDVESFKLVQPRSWKKIVGDKVRRLLHRNTNVDLSENHIFEFIKNEIPQTQYEVNSACQFMHDPRIQKYDAYIVGSDQVWRRPYMEFGVKVMFLNFVKKNQRKISYAASFGVDNLSEYSRDESYIVKESLSKFFAVSVREDDGLHICKSMGVSCVVVLDPVFLLPTSHYLEISMRNTVLSPGDMFVYLLDKYDEEYYTIINDTASRHGYSPFFFSTLTNDSNAMSVEQWIRSFADAKFIITDSFHACAFSIIFNKDFYVLVNNKRGLSRIKSLLQKFRLDDRMLENICDLHNVSFDKIDWAYVNTQREELTYMSMKFLMENLNRGKYVKTT